MMAKIHIATQSDDVPVTLDLHLEQGNWRIVQIENLAQTFQQMGEQS
jgi:hypothetical protein